MRPKLLVELKRFNNKAKKESWRNYQVFLATLLSSIRTKQASDLQHLLFEGDWPGLVKYADGIASTEYSSPAEHRLNHQLSAVIRKYPFPEGLLKNDPEGAAMKIFLASEHQCKRVNQRFTCYRKVRSPYEYDLSMAMSYIKYVLGDLNLSDVFEDCNFGAGASVGVHGNATNMARKLLGDKWTVTPGAYDYAKAIMKTDIHIFELLTKPEGGQYFCLDQNLFNTGFSSRARIIDYNNIAFVPKTVNVHRTIAVEPLLNGYLQKGIDSFMRKRLKRVGIDLSDQRPNQVLAREGSLRHLDDDAWATIDLSSASDSISIELCRFLLPPDWFDLLNSVRSHSYKLKGEVKTYHKFTSMGNGFCFPLETLIFASLCAAAYSKLHLKPDFRVYGDDIIIRKAAFPHLLSLLKVCGFKVNPKKTFAKGPFRESCGADYWEGEDVRPIILDYAFESLENIFKFCNISRSKDSWNTIFSESVEFLQTLIPPILKFVRPYGGNADSCLEVPWDVFMASPYSKYSKKLQCWEWVELEHSAVPDTLAKRFAGYNIALMRGALTGVSSPTPFAERFTSRTKLRRVSYDGGWSITLPGFIAGKVLYYRHM